MSQRGRPSLSQTKALDPSVQLEIEDLIAEAKRATSERDKFKLAASPAAQTRLAEEAKKPWLEREIDVPMGRHRPEQKAARAAAFRDQISAEMSKKRETAKRKNAAIQIQYNAPTPERAAKAEGVTSKTEIPGHGPVAPVKSHYVQSPVDRYGGGWRPELEQAARDLRDIFLLAGSSARITSSYEGMASTVPGARHGGVADHIREAQSIATVIETRFPMCMHDVHWFITELVCSQSGATMRFEEAGRRILRRHDVPATAADDEKYLWKSPDAQKGAGYGGFIRTLEVLEWFLQEQRSMGWGWGARAQNPDAARAIAMELKARAQIMREQQARKEEAEKRKLQKGSG